MSTAVDPWFDRTTGVRVIRARAFETALVLLALLAFVACGGGEETVRGDGEMAEAAPPASEQRSPSSPSAGTAVVANAGSGAPTIRRLRITPSRPKAGDLVMALVEASDPDGDEVSLGYTWSLGTQRLAGGGSEIEIPADAMPDQQLRVAVIASDGKHNSEASIATVTLENRAPEIQAVTFENPKPAPGETLKLIVEANDPDGQPLERQIQWYVNGQWVEARGESFETRGLDRGDRVHAQVRVGDGDDQSRSFTSEKVTIGNTDPQVVSTPGGLGEDGSFRYAVEATDADGDRSFRYTLAEGPAGMKLDPVAGEVVWTPTPDDAGVHWVELVVADRHGGEARQRFDLTIRVAGSESDAAAPITAPPGPLDAKGGAVAAPRP